MDDQPTNCNMNFNQTSTTNSSSSRPSLQSRIQTSIDLNQSLHDHHPRSRPSRSINSNQPLVYPYSFDLLAHHGCVNAISFSKSSQGRWLATGGDDTRVLLWDTFSDFDQIKPVAVYNGPEANIFSIDFTANGNRVLATGLDSKVHVYDIETSAMASQAGKNTEGVASQVISRHSDSCRRVTCHPQEPECFLSASEDGRVIQCDLRLTSYLNAETLLLTEQEYSDVLWNPVSSNLFVTSTDHKLRLYDRRNLSHDPVRNVFLSVLTYTTNLIKSEPKIKLGRPELSSVSFDESGQLLAAMMSKWYPTIWSVEDAEPIAVLKTATTTGPSGEKMGFKDSCTIKHGSFSNSSHSNATYFAAGSDDFRCYGWKLPAIGELKDQRVQVDVPGYIMQTNAEQIAYGRDPITIPTTLNRPDFTLCGHRSIPNSIAFHPWFPFVCTSGVEKVVKIHSKQPVGYPAHVPPGTSLPLAKRTPKEVRSKAWNVDDIPRVLGTGQLENWPVTVGLSDLQRQSEDMETLIMFDTLLLRNEICDYNALVWEGVGLSSSSEDDDSNDDDDDDDDDDLES